MLDNARAKLAADQSAFVAALLRRQQAPEDFNVQRIDAAANALARKRSRAVARTWTSLVDELGEEYPKLFAEFAKQTSLPKCGGSLADGLAFALGLGNKRKLSDATRLQIMSVGLRYAHTAEGLVPRKGMTMKSILLHEHNRLVIALYFPWIGVRSLSLPLGLQ